MNGEQLSVLITLLTTQIMTKFFAVLIVAGIANWYIFIPVAFVIVAFLFVRWYFLKAGREMKRLEAIGQFSIVLYCVLCYWSVLSM